MLQKLPSSCSSRTHTFRKVTCGDPGAIRSNAKFWSPLEHRRSGLRVGTILRAYGSDFGRGAGVRGPAAICRATRGWAVVGGSRLLGLSGGGGRPGVVYPGLRNQGDRGRAAMPRSRCRECGCECMTIARSALAHEHAHSRSHPARQVELPNMKANKSQKPSSPRPSLGGRGPRRFTPGPELQTAGRTLTSADALLKCRTEVLSARPGALQEQEYAERGLGPWIRRKIGPGGMAQRSGCRSGLLEPGLASFLEIHIRTHVLYVKKNSTANDNKNAPSREPTLETFARFSRRGMPE